MFHVYMYALDHVSLFLLVMRRDRTHSMQDSVARGNGELQVFDSFYQFRFLLSPTEYAEMQKLGNAQVEKHMAANANHLGPIVLTVCTRHHFPGHSQDTKIINMAPSCFWGHATHPFFSALGSIELK